MLIRDKITIPPLTGSRKRGLYIWLPDDYEEHMERRYPVLYMFDGHNVFYDEDASFGKSWGMGNYLEQSDAQLIVVGVECNHKGKWRLHEYSPFPAKVEGEGFFKGLGHVYLDWLRDELKPEIDRSFRTLPEREYTYIAGSSMGGLMTLYALTAYNDIFSRGAALSPSIWLTPKRLKDLIRETDFDPNTWLYMTYGTEELGNHLDGKMARIFSQVYSEMLNRGVMGSARIIPGANHSEACWEQDVPIFMSCLQLHGWDNDDYMQMMQYEEESEEYED